MISKWWIGYLFGLGEGGRVGNGKWNQWSNGTQGSWGRTMLLFLLLVTQLANLLLYVVGCRGIYLTREDSNDDDGEYIEECHLLNSMRFHCKLFVRLFRIF